KAAISNGCDAIYLGMQKFGARAYCGSESNSGSGQIMAYINARTADSAIGVFRVQSFACWLIMKMIFVLLTSISLSSLLIVQLNIKEQERARAAQYWAALKLAASTIAVNVAEVRKSLFERHSFHILKLHHL
ncbi:hypothetical protein QW71_35390, partial [Paenibacillus sp. IHB B 3415]|uniref:hypothetical protein n=1 Tax=Paenibacillus sp. IHB B 3415 TaxID=867080 RepID=UPI000573A46A